MSETETAREEAIAKDVETLEGCIETSGAPTVVFAGRAALYRLTSHLAHLTQALEAVSATRRDMMERIVEGRVGNNPESLIDVLGNLADRALTPTTPPEETK